MKNFVPTRRQFIQAAGLAVGGAVAGLTFETTAQARQVRVRPNIADLQEGSRALQALRDGVAAMKKLDHTSPRDPRGWEQQARIHLNFCPHSNWFFLPWHRAYLHYFEQICRAASGWADFTLPYWDWTTSPNIPAQFWGANNPLFDA
ncbi:MAG: tyrosinase family protein, partial [Pyrinomonadaceae bacterium]